ncbi:MAG: SAM-dependent DNA methyltransferase [Bacteroidaceae bacterium]|nr:SAM-dependent DNA methyltransferase [Bacteroidaceae bacterium]
MSTEELQKRTTVNIQEKANLIWAIADKLVGTYKPHEYGNVILPMCVIKRFSDTLAPTKQKVLDANAVCEQRGLAVRKGFLTTASGYDFYNVSPFTFEGLLSDADNIADNFRSYLNHFSENVVDIIEKFDFDKEITKLDHNGILYNVIQEFCSKKAYMGADEISAVDMGYIFEELVRKFSESYDEQAGAHFTARDIIYMMAELLVAPQREQLVKDGVTATVYDMAMGTSQMLDCLSEKLLAIDPEAQITEFGQELNEQTFAIAKANVLIKGGDADNMRHGNTLSDDKFEGYTFDYIISNPPFGIEWKNEKKTVEEEHKRGDMGRFAPGLPAIGDSQQLFMLNGIAKLKDTGRMAIIQNGSPLFKGDAGSGESNIRGYLLDNDWLEAIVQIPNDMFYNTGIATYIWVVTKDKAPERVGKVQLIDASKCCEKRRKSLGNKRNEFTDPCISLISKAYMAFTDGVFEDGELVVESKIKDCDDFKFTKVAIKLPEKKKDTENVPFKEDIETYMQKNVYPYAPEAKVDMKASKIGYEIPFTREFYKYVAPRKSEEIFDHLQELEQQETALMAKIMGR